MCYNGNMDSRAGTASTSKRHLSPCEAHLVGLQGALLLRTAPGIHPPAIAVGTTAKQQRHGDKDARDLFR